ncbi:DUF2851 family protein [Bacteroidia bacterium]|nr:DUF2851 family protein [Bacteroidia bacterium]
MSFGYKEDLLQFIWEHQLYDTQNITTNSGQHIQVINQGFLNRSNGPNFENAKIIIDDTTHCGSVEIHIDGKDWNHHAHHQDKAFNNVVLHVCYSILTDVVREDGTSVPSLAIGDRINNAALLKYDRLMKNKAYIPCENQVHTLSDFDKNMWLDRMIVERLESRCAAFDTYLTHSKGDWNHAFFTALVRSFGMPANTEAFEELANMVTYDIIQKHHKSLFQLEALFFGAAGLLRDEIADNYYVGLQKEWGFLSQKYGLSSSHTLLKTGRMRPMNLPTVKIAQLAAFFHHVPLFIQKVLDLPAVDEVKRKLTFMPSDYWETHYTFKKSSEKKTKGISTGFVNHLFLNAIIPFVFFYEKNKKDGATDKSLAYLQSITSEKNTIITQWKTIGMDSKNALTSQALLHLYKTYCKSQRCLQCNLGKKLLLK